MRINFQPGYEFSLPANFIPDGGAIFKDIYGYGWSRSRGDNTRKRNINSDKRYDSFVNCEGSETSVDWNYELDATNPGTYYIYCSVGDAGYSAPRQYVSVDGTMLVNNVTTNANEFYEVRNSPVTLSDDNANGTIDATVTIGHDTEDSWTCLNYLIINDQQVQPWTFPIQIDFHPSYRDPASGYISDTGAYYDVVRRYGWDLEGLNSDDNDVNDPGDVRLETMVYTEGGETANWRIEEIPSGSYHVQMVFGDADYASGPYGVVIQGIDRSFGSLTANQFQTIDQDITVGSDNTITLQMGHATGWDCICYMIISQN